MIDIIIAIFLIWFIYKGFTKGFIIEVSSLIALILGIYAAVNFSFFVSGFLHNDLGWHSKYTDIAAFCITFLLVIVLVMLVGKIIEKLVNIIQLGFLNKLAGTLFGIVKGALILSFLILIINNFDPREKVFSKERREASFLYTPVASLAPALFLFFSDDKFSLDLDRVMDEDNYPDEVQL